MNLTKLLKYGKCRNYDEIFIINVVCKYLRQFLDTSFGVATLPIYCNIE